MNKTCARCNLQLPLIDFKPVGRPRFDGLIAYTDVCIFCRKAKQKLKARTQRKIDLRQVVFDHYGWVCACCNEQTIQFLSLDHVNGGGSLENKNPLKMYRSIIAQNFPSTYQILCMNCNWAKGRYGVCPHKQM